jgi:hypothetical protein
LKYLFHLDSVSWLKNFPKLAAENRAAVRGAVHLQAAGDGRANAGGIEGAT